MSKRELRTLYHLLIKLFNKTNPDNRILLEEIRDVIYDVADRLEYR